MEVTLTSDQEAFIRQAIDAGRLRHADEAVKEALLLWEDRERRRTDLLMAIDEAEASIAGGEGIEITRESMTELAVRVKQRGRARLLAEQQSPR
jgi:putative addiction module CopG family antidote